MRLVVLGRAIGLVACAGVLAACSAALKFSECNTDPDCERFSEGGTKAMYCTTDHLCVDKVPEERLCERKVGAVGTPEAMVVAGLFRLSLQPSSQLDDAMQKAVELAVDEINRQSPPRKVVLLVCDTGADPEQGARALEHAARVHHAVAVVGPTTSGLTLGLASTAVKQDVLVVSPSATSPAISQINDNGLIWRTGASDLLQARVLALEVDPATTVLDILYANTPYGVGLHDAFLSAWAPKTVKNTFAFEELSVPTDQIDRMALDLPGEAIIVADPDAPAIVQALGSVGGLSATKFLMTDAAKGTTLFGDNPAAIAGVLSRVRGTGPANPSEPTHPSTSVYTTFRSRYVDRYQGMDPSNTAFVANAYDAIYVVAMAGASIAPPARLTGSALAAVLGRMSKSPATASDVVNVGSTEFLKGSTALAQGGEIDVVGASGPIDFDAATGDVLTAPIEVWEVLTTNPAAPVFRTKRVVTP